MAINILQRPIGQQLSTSVTAAATSDTYTNDVLITKSAHGLVDGNFIYIICNIEDYNGFWYVTVVNANVFKIKSYPLASFVDWIQDCPIIYYVSQGQCKWSSVHLPIVYKFNNINYPTNTADIARTITSYVNDGGFVKITCSGSLGTIHHYDSVKITGATSNVNGIYQVMSNVSGSVMTINLANDSYVFGSATIQKYYPNYHIAINVYAGLNSSHFWASKKAYELAGTIRMIPDSNNEVLLSINEILKSYIKSKNDLLLGTLPNNLDAFVGFYIETFESYSVGTGYSFLTYESAHTSDQSTFEGFAVNAKLPFKNVQSGYLSDYLMNNTAGKFLTLFAIPVLFAGCSDPNSCYFDVSFINPLTYNSANLLYLRQAYYKSGVLQSTVDKLISNYDNGVYRIRPDDPSCSNDRVDLSVVGNFQPFPATSYTDLGGGLPWSYVGGTYYYSFTRSSGSTYTTDKIAIPFKAPAGTYVVNGSYNNTALTAPNTASCTSYFLDASFNIIGTSSPSSITPTFGGIGGSITTTKEIFYVAFDMTYTYISGPNTFTVAFNFGINTNTTTISETKQVSINCDCMNQSIRLSWLNYLGGFDYWTFTTEKDYTVNITEETQTKTNIFPSWPSSYGENADTIRKEIMRKSNQQITIHSQGIDQAQLTALEYIKTSPLVQIVNSRNDRRTVIVDKNSFKVYSDNQKVFTIDLTIDFTDDIPSQSV